MFQPAQTTARLRRRDPRHHPAPVPEDQRPDRQPPRPRLGPPQPAHLLPDPAPRRATRRHHSSLVGRTSTQIRVHLTLDGGPNPCTKIGANGFSLVPERSKQKRQRGLICGDVGLYAPRSHAPSSPGVRIPRESRARFGSPETSSSGHTRPRPASTHWTGRSHPDTAHPNSRHVARALDALRPTVREPGHSPDRVAHISPLGWMKIGVDLGGFSAEDCTDRQRSAQPCSILPGQSRPSPHICSSGRWAHVTVI